MEGEGGNALCKVGKSENMDKSAKSRVRECGDTYECCEGEEGKSEGRWCEGGWEDE